MRRLELFECRLGLSPCTDFAFPYQFAHPVSDLGRVALLRHAVLGVEVDIVSLQPPERTFHCLPDARTAQFTFRPLLSGQGGRGEFGGDDHPVAERLERLPHQFLVLVTTVYFRRIEEGAAFIVGFPYQPDGFRLAWASPISVRKSHAAEADRRDFHIC